MEYLVYALCLILIYKFLDWLIRLPRVSGITDKHVFITGCDTGFGNLIAKKLDGLGVHVYAGCYTETGEVELKKSCSKKLVTPMG